MRHTTHQLKPILPLYRPPQNTKRRSTRNLSDSNPDDQEVSERRISELEMELQTLNILEHPLRIIEICNQIRSLKKQISRPGK